MDAGNLEAASEIPALIKKQVGETVLCMVNLAKLEEAYEEGAIKVQFPTGEDLEPRHYVYQPRHGGVMRRENPETESLWFSEQVNIGDVDTLADKFSLMTARGDDAGGNDTDVDGEYNQTDGATDLADRLVQDWTNLKAIEDTEAWEVDSDKAPVATAEQKPPANADSPNTKIQKAKPEIFDLRALYLSQSALITPLNGAGTHPTSAMSPAKEFEVMRRIIESCFSVLNEDGSDECYIQRGQEDHRRLIKHRAIVKESYIMHIRVIEDAAFPNSRPPLSSKTENKKPRCLVISVRRSGRLRMHTSRENADGTFAILRSWNLYDLTAVEVSSTKGILVQFDKVFYWRALSEENRGFFVSSLVEVCRKYNRGKIPKLVGFSNLLVARAMW